MQQNVDRRATNREPSYPKAQCVSMEPMLSKHDNTAPAVASLKIESHTVQHADLLMLRPYKLNILTQAISF